MNRFLLLGVVALSGALLMPASSMASQERLMDTGELRATSPGAGDSGPVVVTATRGPNGLSALAVQAFGRTTRLTADQLAKLHGPFVSGLQLSYDVGYKELGGRTVHVLLLSYDYMSGVHEAQSILVNEKGDVTVMLPYRGSH